MICIYDSGVGGLTALRALRALSPLTDVVYLGDTARVPYGAKDADTVCRYAAEALSYLSALSPEAILVACGTVSTVALPRLSARYSVPVVGVADAGIRAALTAAPEGRIAVLGTEATVLCGYFRERILATRPTATVSSLSCPLFVTLAEAGMIEEDDPIPALVAERMLAPLAGFSPEAIILGCTHFPWLSPHIGRLFPKARLIDCGLEAVASLLPSLKIPGTGRTRLLVTDGAAAFLRTAHRMMGNAIGAAVETVIL